MGEVLRMDVNELTNWLLLSHVLPWSWCVRFLSSRVVYSDGSALEYDSIELLDTSRGVVNGSHGDESESSRSVSLYISCVPTTIRRAGNLTL
jgi:hypothetical protein